MCTLSSDSPENNERPDPIEEGTYVFLAEEQEEFARLTSQSPQALTGAVSPLLLIARFARRGSLPLREGSLGRPMVHVSVDALLLRRVQMGEPLRWTRRLLSLTRTQRRVSETVGIELVDEHGERVATLSTTSALLLSIGQSRSSHPSPTADLQRSFDDAHKSVLIPAELGKTYSELLNLTNAAHWDLAAARAGGFPDLLLPGTATLALASDVMFGNTGEIYRIRRLTTQFRRPVFGDTKLMARLTWNYDKRAVMTVSDAATGIEVLGSEVTMNA